MQIMGIRGRGTGSSWCSIGTDEKKAEVVSKCILAEPKHGEVWARIAEGSKEFRVGRGGGTDEDRQGG